jgi:tetratricopeptide (TPR) repeat protein
MARTKGEGGARRPLALLGAATAIAGAALFGGVFAETPEPSAASDLSTLVEEISAGRTAEAVRRLEDREDGPSLALLGLAYQQRFRETGDASFLTRSERTLRRALALGGDRAVTTTGLASLAATRHRFGDAVGLARRALRLDPESASAYGVLGDSLVELGRYREAFAAFDRMAALAPGVGSYARVAQARELLGRREAALEPLELALELDRTGPEDRAYAHVRIGRIHQDAGRLAQAARSYRSALRERPGYVHARAGLALVQADRGRWRAAVGGLRLVLADLPSVEYAVALGDVLAQLGRPAEAEREYARAQRLERRLAENGVRTELQSALFDLDHDRNLRPALARAREGRKLRPGIEGEHVLAWALYKNGRCAEARVHSIRALRLGTLDLDAIYHRSLIEACLGNRRAAAELRARLTRLNPYYLVAPPSAYRVGD